MERVIDLPQKTTFKPYYWLYENSDIYISGLTKDNRSVLAIVKNFLYDSYLELPKSKSWSKSSCESLIEFFNDKAEFGKYNIVSYKLCKRYNLKYNEEINCVQLFFINQIEARNFNRFISYRDLYTPLGKLNKGQLLLHEHNIDPIIKFTAERDIKLSDWISVEEEILDEDLNLSREERKFSSSKIDCYTIPSKVSPVSLKTYTPTHPKYLSFDIECYCINLNSKIPDPKIEENIVLSVSLVIGRGDNLEKKILIIVGDSLDINGVETIRCKTERELLLNFTQIVQKENPDIFLGYNILSFDWNYMIERAILLKLDDFFKLGRDYNPSKIRKMDWGSKAYGDNQYYYIETIGRLHIDLMIDVQRNHKLQKYSLDFVSEKFLGMSKKDISPKQLFLIYKLWLEFKDKAIIDPEAVKKILPLYYCTGILKKIRNELFAGNKEILRYGLHLVGDYNVEDSNLTLLLFQKLEIWNSLQEMSNVVCVPISWIHTRGQQIRCVSQLYRITLHDKNIIPYFKKDTEKQDVGYKGAIVLEAKTGFHEVVQTLDFESLYPSLIRAFNICLKTLVIDEKIPDSECNIVEWEEDGKKYRYRYRKVSINDKGEFINEGSFPKLVRVLLTKRKAVRAEIATCKDAKYKAILNLRQLAFKVAANSAYGIMGFDGGYLPFKQGASSVTAMGREFIRKSIEYIKREYPGSDVIYGDTDSCMIKFMYTVLEEVFKMGEECGKRVSIYLKSCLLGITEGEVDSHPLINSVPVNLVPENVYGKFFLLTKKRYIAHCIDKTGKTINKISKGVMLCRRDNCKFVRDSYQMVVDAIFDSKSKADIIDLAIQRIKLLVTRQIPDSELVIVKGVKSLLSYAVKNKKGQFIDKDKNVLEDSITDPLDSRLVYKNIPQVLFLKKILERGDIVPPNSRLEFIYLRKDDAEYDGEKIEDYQYYKESRKHFGLRPDYIHCVESQFETQLSQLIEVKFGYKTMERETDLEKKLNLPSFIKKKKDKIVYALRNTESKYEKLQLQTYLGRVITKRRKRQTNIVNIDENFIKDTVKQLYLHRQIVKDINGLRYN
jgi:DNA polymerase delta subunit 1